MSDMTTLYNSHVLLFTASKKNLPFCTPPFVLLKKKRKEKKNSDNICLDSNKIKFYNYKVLSIGSSKRYNKKLVNQLSVNCKILASPEKKKLVSFSELHYQ